jgi:NAD(P)-dependent dehydrogenase (short-subunit alcohol dehydrogenase family)
VQRVPLPVKRYVSATCQEAHVSTIDQEVPSFNPYGVNADKLFELRGKTVVITGGNRGIGLMLAIGLDRAGAEVTIIGRDEEAGARAVELMEGRTRWIRADLRTEGGVRGAVEQIAEVNSAVSVLVNNAAVVTRSPLAETKSESWDEVLDVNLKAPFYLVREMLSLLEKAASVEDPARVINIGSIEGLRASGLPHFPYSSSKAGLNHLTRTMAKDLGRRNITVNLIAPGVFPTELSAPSIAARRQLIEADTPLGRYLGGADDMVAAVTYLAGFGGAFVTGAIIPVDGGLSLRW